MTLDQDAVVATGIAAILALVIYGFGASAGWGQGRADCLAEWLEVQHEPR